MFARFFLNPLRYALTSTVRTVTAPARLVRRAFDDLLDVVLEDQYEPDYVDLSNYQPPVEEFKEQASYAPATPELADRVNGMIYDDGPFNQPVADLMINTPTEQAARDLLATIVNTLDNPLLYISFGNETGVFNLKDNKGVEMFIKLVTARVIEEEDEDDVTEDGYDYKIKLSTINKFSVFDLADRDARRRLHNRSGGFFPFFCTIPIDLSRYQIYQSEPKKEEENCMISTLRNLGISEEALNSVKLNFTSGKVVSRANFKAISNTIGHRIVLHYYYHTVDGEGSRKKKKMEYYGNSELPEINIALYESHLFPYEQTPFSKKDVLEAMGHDVSKSKAVTKLFSLQLIKFLQDSGCLSKPRNPYLHHQIKVKREDIPLSYYKNEFRQLSKIRDPSMNTRLGRSLINSHPDEMTEVRAVIHDYSVAVANGTERPDWKPLHKLARKVKYIEDHKKNAEVIKQASKQVYNITYADCETDVSSKTHKLLMIGAERLIDNRRQYKLFEVSHYGSEEATISAFLDFCVQDSKATNFVYFHNLKYDASIIFNSLDVTKYLSQGSRLFYLSAKHKGVSVTFKDSYKLISEPLSKFTKMFDLENRKQECIAYEYFTSDNVDKIIPVEQYLKLLKPEEITKLQDSAQPWLKRHNGQITFDPWGYYRFYLKQDVVTLREGMEKFDSIFRELDPEISVFDYLTIASLAKAYFQPHLLPMPVVDSNLRHFIGSCFTGGNCQLNPKFKSVLIEEPVLDLDVTSLYPTATILASEEGLFNTGEPQRRTDNWQQYTTFMKVRCIRVTKPSTPPIVVYKDDHDNNVYTNDPAGRIINMDSGTLKNYIDFAGLEYEILDGIQFRGPPLNIPMRAMFNERKKVKKTNKAMSTAIKLLMNSFYGKTIQKQRHTKEMLKDEDEAIKYILNQFGTFIKYKPVGKTKYEVQCHSVDYSSAHTMIGAVILSRAKRLMFELRDAIREAGCDLIYTDTDSAFILKSQFDKINAVYKAKYGHDLDDRSGEPGTFHNDLPGDAPHADKAIFFGKKAYMLKIGDTWHKTFKGITKAGLNTLDPEQTIKDLQAGKPVKVLMNPPGTVRFEVDFGQVTTSELFYRTLQFT